MSTKSRQRLLGALFIAIGVTMLLLSFPKFYENKSVVYASGYVTLDPTSIGDLDLTVKNNFFYYGENYANVKQVEVVVSNVPRPYFDNGTQNNNKYLAKQFEIVLFNAAENVSAHDVTATIVTSGLNSGPVEHVFDFPSDWTKISVVEITNPDNNTSAATVTVILHRQLVSNPWVAVAIVGAILAIIGLLLFVKNKRVNELNMSKQNK